MADPTLNSSGTEMNEIFLDGIICPYQLFIAESKMPEAGFGLFVREEIPAGKEVFRSMPAISVVATLINHSCDPNAHHLSEGPELVVRSSRKIAKNEEITISYIDPTQSFEERQKALSNSYAFGCQCRKCTKGFEEQEEILTGNPVLDTPIRNVKSKLYVLLDALADGTQELDGVETKMREICNEPFSRKPWPINASPLPTLYELLARKFEDERQWEKALCVWLRIVYIIDPLRYPERLNPHRVAHLMALCQLEGRISQMSEIDVGVKASFRTIEAAMSGVQYHHNIQLKEDAAASLGTNHVIFKIAAHYVEVMDKQMATGMGVNPGVWQSERVKDTMKERYESRKLELLKWAHIDLPPMII
ncbi:MAG: hypothetical protein Q9217_002267 [Psora testacea]